MKATVVDQIVLKPDDPSHAPSIHVLARKDGWEIIRTTAFYTCHLDHHGKFRRRHGATVSFRAIGSSFAKRLVLWEGSYSSKNLEDCPLASEVANRMGLSVLDLLQYLDRNKTVIYD